MIRVDPGHLRSGSCSPSRPGEACSPLEESQPESLYTQLSPSLLTLLSLRSTAFVTFVSETSKLPVKVKPKLCSFVTKSAKSNLRLSTILRREQIGQPMMIIADLLALAAASVDAEAGVGNAVYMLPSFYNHDCDPNAHILWIQNAEARLKALRDVEEGEELRICYIDASMAHDARQTLLSKGFGFQCNCLRCLSRD